MKRTNDELNDMGLFVHTLSKTNRPSTIIYAAMIQDYTESSPHKLMFSGIDGEDCLPNCEVQDPKNLGKSLSESEAARRVIKNGLKRKHFGPLEHPQIILNVIGFPHTTMQQLRTHRTGISFDVQSFRNTGQNILDVADGLKEVEEVFYVRPVGKYQHGGSLLDYTEQMREEDLYVAFSHASRFKAAVVNFGYPYEMARDNYINYGVRQNFVLSGNLRAMFHLLDMRNKGDASLECQQFCQLLISELSKWVPEITDYYLESRGGKNLIAP